MKKNILDKNRFRLLGRILAAAIFLPLIFHGGAHTAIADVENADENPETEESAETGEEKAENFGSNVSRGYDVRVMWGDEVTADDLVASVLAEGEVFTDYLIEEEIRYGKVTPVFELEKEVYPIESVGDRIFLLYGMDEEGNEKVLPVRVAVDLPDAEWTEGPQKSVYQEFTDENGNDYRMTVGYTGSRETSISFADGGRSVLKMLPNGAFYTEDIRPVGEEAEESLYVYQKSANGTVFRLNWDGYAGEIVEQAADGSDLILKLEKKNGRLIKIREWQTEEEPAEEETAEAEPEETEPIESEPEPVETEPLETEPEEPESIELEPEEETEEPEPIEIEPEGPGSDIQLPEIPI
ncbi:MAG: hypothetical protein IKQ96_05235 [Lachnospiraceae bacterium]|nr:hypothetical protein [Lachnospiraceae bacterium]